MMECDYLTRKPSDCFVSLGNSDFELGHDKDPALSFAHSPCYFFIPNRTLDFHQCTLVDELRALRVDGKGLGNIPQTEKWFLPVLGFHGEVKGNERPCRG